MFFEGKARSARELRRLTAWHAWHAGVIAQTTKIPDLEALMGPDGDGDRPRRRQTPEQQFAVAAAWNAHLHGKVLYRDTD